MPIVRPPPNAVPTNAAPLPRLVASAQSLGLERHLALAWLVLAWRDSGRPHHLDILSGAASASR